MLRIRIIRMRIRFLPNKFDADSDPNLIFQIKAQNLEIQKNAQIGSYSYILACHLQIDADPDPAYHFDADPSFQVKADPDPQQCRKTKYFHEKKKKYLVI